MPTWWGLAGTAIVTRTETAEVTGTVTIEATPEVYVEGTVTIDRASVAAWAAPVRRTCTRVLVGDEGEDMVRLHGDVSVNLDGDAGVARATFQLTDERCAFFAEDSIATGGVPVTIRCRIGTETVSADTAVFRGLTEAAPNEGAYVPTATVQCAGEGNDWLAEKVCLDISAFAGLTRLDALRQAAESVGIDPDRIIGGEEWGTFRLPLNVSGISAWELARRFAKLEDSFLRIVDGNLEILPARLVVGSGAAPVLDLDGDYYFSAAETPPNRPVSRLVLSTIGIPEEVLTGGVEVVTPELYYGTTADGVYWERRITTTTVNGAMIRQRTEEWRDAAIPGETPSEVAFRLWKLTETENVWGAVTVEGVSLLTGRIVSSSTTVREWFSPLCATSTGTVWADGSRHADASATWQVTSTEATTYVYDGVPDCILKSKTTAKGGWYSPLVAVGNSYPDGSTRSDTVYQWTAETAAQPFEVVEELNAEETADAFSAVETSTTTYGWKATDGVDAWGEKSGSKTRWSTIPGSGIITEATFTFAADGSSEGNSKSYAGTLPILPRAPELTPQYRTKPVQLYVTADEAALTTSPRSETAWGAETMDDLVRYARHVLREELSPTATFLHPANPHLKLYHPVNADDAARAIDMRQGYVKAIQMTLNASQTGALKQQTTVVLPLEQYNPGAVGFAA